MLAPMEVSGSMIRFIGREFKDLSPESSGVKRLSGKDTEISLVVVPLFPTSRMEDGIQSVKSFSVDDHF